MLQLSAQSFQPVDYVNPFIGTEKSSHFTMWESKGATFPGVLRPYGMVQITPDGYTYSDKEIKSFSFINHASGYGSNGDFNLMACTGTLANSKNASSKFSHKHESSKPYLYQVMLQSFNITASFTATERVGLGKFIFPKSDSAHFIFSALTNVSLVDSSSIRGYCGGYYFIAKFSKPFKHFGLLSPVTKTIETASINKIPTSFRIDFLTVTDEIILVKVGFSTTSFTGVENNILKEMPGWDFENNCKNSKKIWNEKLRQIEIKSPDENAKEIFYTALYHTMFMPVVLSDAASVKDKYNALFPWDTYRTEHPLITLLNPERESNMVSSVLSVYDNTGWLPTDNMMGNHNTQVILDSYIKGAANFDVSKACAAMVKSLNDSPYARREMADFIKYKYVPASTTSSVTHSLEFAYDNWAAATFLERTGNKTKYHQAYKTFMQRAAWYRNSYNAATGFMEAKTISGRWAEGGYSEGTPWTYSWSVPQDVQGLINLMGGKKLFLKKLEQCFDRGYYVHDNEPPLHYAYLFNYCGAPWKTQYYANKIVTDSYSTDPGGLPGNDDLGTLSSWYVFSAMGFYPVTPGTDQYQIGSPIFKETSIHLTNGNQFTIKANNLSPQNKYIQAASINGTALNCPWFTHQQILNGSKIIFEMGPLPNKKWGSSDKYKPYSITKATPHFNIISIRLPSKKNKANHTVDIAINVCNSSKTAGTISVPVLVDGQLFTTASALLDAGEKSTIHVPLTLYHQGIHQLKIKGLPKVQIQIQKTIPIFLYSDITIPFPPIFYLQDTIPISVKVKNEGSYKASKMVTLFMNNAAIQTQRITLNAGREKEIKFHVPAYENGVIKFSINTSDSVLVNVFNPALKRSNDYSKLSFLDPVLIMDFDQAPAAEVKDFSGHQDNGIVIGNLNWVDGVFGKAIQTNAAAENYLVFKDSSALGKAGESTLLTMMAWIYPLDEKNFSDIISKGDWQAIQLKGSNQFINFYSSGWEGHEAVVSVPKNWNRHWHHIAGVADGNYFKLYVDGKLSATKKSEPRNPLGETGTSIYANNLWNIGRNENSPDRIFNGYIDDVMIFKKDLTQQQIIDIMLHNF